MTFGFTIETFTWGMHCEDMCAMRSLFTKRLAIRPSSESTSADFQHHATPSPRQASNATRNADDRHAVAEPRELLVKIE